MRIAVISDVHGQVGTLRLALDAIDRLACDEIWCVGDVVDALGAAPMADLEAAVDLVASRCTVTLGGNHELWCLQRGLLSLATRMVIAGWTPRAERHGILAVHASAVEPVLEFIDSPQTAAASLTAAGRPMTLYGHTHRPGIWGRAARNIADPTWTPARNGTPVDLRSDEHRLLNPGAICHREPTYLLLDLTARSATWHPVSQ